MNQRIKMILGAIMLSIVSASMAHAVPSPAVIEEFIKDHHLSEQIKRYQSNPDQVMQKVRDWNLQQKELVPQERELFKNHFTELKTIWRSYFNELSGKKLTVQDLAALEKILHDPQFGNFRWTAGFTLYLARGKTEDIADAIVLSHYGPAVFETMPDPQFEQIVAEVLRRLEVERINWLALDKNKPTKPTGWLNGQGPRGIAAGVNSGFAQWAGALFFQHVKPELRKEFLVLLSYLQTIPGIEGSEYNRMGISIPDVYKHIAKQSKEGAAEWIAQLLDENRIKNVTAIWKYVPESRPAIQKAVADYRTALGQRLSATANLVKGKLLSPSSAESEKK